MRFGVVWYDVVWYVVDSVMWNGMDVEWYGVMLSGVVRDGVRS